MSKEYKRFNLNNHVKVRLTNAGLEIYQKYCDNAAAEIGFPYIGKEPDKEGYHAFPMYELCHIFGNELTVGNQEPPFSMHVLIEMEGD